MGLDDSQSDVVKYSPKDSIYVTAPPGYGKTFVMKERIKYLIEIGFVNPPKKLLGLTFTNAAADEMKERITESIPDSGKYVEIMNFHTLAFKILKNYGHLIDINRDFKIVDQNKIDTFKEKFFEEKDIELEPYKLKRGYDKWFRKNHLQGKDSSPGREGLYKELKREIEEKYIDEENLDFNNLLFKCNELLRECKEVKTIYNCKYKYILVDEFQDTNFEQYKLLKKISRFTSDKRRGVFAVGDKKQSIMKFQGAHPENIEIFKDEFDAPEKELKVNHRTSSKKIRELTRKLRDPTYSIDDSKKYEMYINKKIDQEHDKIIEKIKELQEESVSLDDICVMFRSRGLAENLMEKLKKETSIDYIFLKELSGKEIFEKYSKLFEEIEELIEKEYDRGSVNKVVKKLIRENYDEEDIVLKTIKNFSRKFDTVKYHQKEIWERLNDFYNHLSLEVNWKELLKPKIKDKLFLSTIHGTKGLEFKYVFMFGIVEYRMPHHSKCWSCNDYNSSTEIDISDEKDVFYVGISRTIEDIIFFYSKQDEKNLGKKRKISCLFEDFKESIVLIDPEGNKINLEDFKALLCQKEDT